MDAQERKDNEQKKVFYVDFFIFVIKMWSNIPQKIFFFFDVVLKVEAFVAQNKKILRAINQHKNTNQVH